MAFDVLLAFAGTGEISWEVAAALLDDHLDGYDEGASIEAVLPVTADTEGPAEKIVYKFLRTVDIPYDIVTDGTDVRAQRDLVRGAADEREVEDVAHAIVNRLVAAEQAGRVAKLIVSLDEGVEPDDVTSALIADAQAHDIPVLDLANGLMELGQEDEVVEEPPADVERSNDTSALVDRAYELVVPLLGRAGRVYEALTVLGLNTELYEAENLRLAEAASTMEELREALTAPEPEPEPAPVEKPKRAPRKKKAEPQDEAVGTPREAVAQETRKVLLLADGRYKAVGRGRRPAGSKVEEVPIDFYNNLELSS